MAPLRGGLHDPRYLGFFSCFNQALYYEAHDVLEDLWLESRGQPLDLFYKALIQLAGAFVHLQKHRLHPAGSLFKLSNSYLIRFAPVCEQLDVVATLTLSNTWRSLLEESNWTVNPLGHRPAPELNLLS